MHKESGSGELTAAHRAMQRGSLSFYFASRFLPGPSRDAVRRLYAWCRYADDVIDEAPAAASAAEKTLLVDELRRKTYAALRGKTAGHPVFSALGALAKTHKVPEIYLQDLLSGMEMDAAGSSYPDQAALELYCYRVAGAVGVLFSHLTGVSDARALRHAAALGMAMQMTNIARDVFADAGLGRSYLPTQWLAEAGLDQINMLLPENRTALASVVGRLLRRAKELYELGDDGLRFLPVRTAFAVALARLIYAAIGDIVARRGVGAWDARAVVPLWFKLLLVPRAARVVAPILWQRRRERWEPAVPLALWRFSV